MKKSLFLILILFTMHHALKSNNTASIDARPTTIIVNFNSLYRPNETKTIQHIRKTLGLWYGLRLLLSGIPTADEARDELMSTLQDIPLLNNLSIQPETWQTKYVLWDRNYPLPPILNQFLTSDSSIEEEKICKHVHKQILNNKTIKKTHRYILDGASDFLFQSKYINPVMEPSDPLIHVLQHAQQQGYVMILIANMPGYGWDQFLAHEPQAQIMKHLFPENCRYISGKMHQLPTSPACIDRILKEHHLQPHNCLLIANHSKDAAYPTKLGMRIFIFDDQNEKNAQENPDILHHDITKILGAKL